MARRLCVLFALVVAAGGQLPAQQFPPGYVDPGPVLAAASKAAETAAAHAMTSATAG